MLEFIYMKGTVVWQRVENLAIALAFSYFYFRADFTWWWYLAGILAVDIFMVGYLHNNKTGAFSYNLGHSYLLPVGLLVVAYLVNNPTVTGASYIWLAHIGFDRAMGFGLKSTKGFKHTHLGDLS